jgi:hypothetical protein
MQTFLIVVAVAAVGMGARLSPRAGDIVDDRGRIGLLLMMLLGGVSQVIVILAG